METKIFIFLFISTLGYLIYYIFLRNEKVLNYNRFYLLSIFWISIILPFIEIEVSSIQNSVRDVRLEKVWDEIVINKTDSTGYYIDYQNIIIGFWLTVSFFFLLRYFFGLAKLFNTIYRHIKVRRDNFTYVLIPDLPISYNFLHYIMVNEQDFNNNTVEKEILYHEQQHAKQLHSLDILFTELFFCFTWFHPIIYFLKKELKTTHEFLADEFVIQQKVSPKDYQNLILHTTNKHQTQFVNNFNYLTTKKRFIMMTKSISRTKSSVLQISTSVFLLFFALMSMMIPAQKKSNVIAKKSETSKQTAKAKEVKANLPTKEKAKIAKKNKDKVSKEDEVENLTEAVPQGFAVNSNNQINTNYKEAEYENGINEFRKLFAANFDTSKVDMQKGIIKTIVKIDLDEKGMVKNIYAEGSNQTFNNEAVSAMTKIVSKNKFIPAQQDGINVASKFQFPITMNFE